MDNRIGLHPEKWVSVYGDLLYAYTVVRVKDKPAAEDIVQETFLSAWKSRAGYQGQASEKNWLFAICKNKIIDFYRRQSSGMARLVTREEDAYFNSADHWTSATRPNEWGIDYSQPLDRPEFYSMLHQCQQKLNTLQQSVFVLKYMEELASEEICKVLAIEPSYYWVLMHRAKLHLRKCLEKNWINR